MAKVLYVEDDPAHRDILTLQLELNGYEVAVAGDGLEGVEKARSWLPDVILMDLRMPRMAGFEAIRILRAETVTADIPIIAITALPSARDRERALVAGANEYFGKPFDFNRLLTAIGQYLPEDRSVTAKQDVESQAQEETLADDLEAEEIRVRQSPPPTEFPIPLRSHLHTLPFSHVGVPDQVAERPAAWLSGAAAAGWPLPLGLARDLGLLLRRPGDQLTIAKPGHLPFDEDTTAYLAFLERLARQPLVRELPFWQPPLSDPVLAVVLARLVEGLDLPEAYRPPTGPDGVVFSRDLATALTQTDPARLWRDIPLAERPAWTKLLPPASLARIEANLNRLDPTELRFLVRFGPPLPGSPDPRDLLDLLALTHLPAPVRLALSQSLKLLPRVSAARTVGGVQTYPEGGYESIARKGSLDSLLLTEVAYPEEIFLHRLLNHEALYYGRERPRERRRELAYIVAHSGLGLGGDGQVLAKALLLALGQAMRQRGYEVLYSLAGPTLSEPRPLDKAGELSRVLYHQERGRVDEEQVLRAVLKQLHGWRERYRGRQVLWVLSEFFDADFCEERAGLYRALRAEGGHQAWYIRLGPLQDRAGGHPGNGHRRPPATARYFESWQVVETGLMWQDTPPPPVREMPAAPPKPVWQRWRGEIEGRPFRAGVRDVLHFSQPAQWAAWLELAELEDRPEVDAYLRSLSPPEMIYIPPGSFLMGSAEDDPDAAENEKPQHEVRLRGYYIDRTPVTNVRFRKFIEAGGYQEEGYWAEARAAGHWRDGKYIYAGEHDQPRYWDDDRFNDPEQPVVGVSWYEALAYARWAGKHLPSEAQWEKAAGWDPAAKQKRKYPWGDEWDASRCNGSGVDRTTPVGRYSPVGDSAYGLVDMAGNVYEWCTSRWGTNRNGADYGYPFDLNDDREDLSGGDPMLRILRGGCWGMNGPQKFVRCGFRSGNRPGDRVDFWGYRCVTPHAFFPSVLGSEF